jgi:hypothetical protein
MSSQAAGQDGAADFSDSEFEFDCPQWTDFSQDNYDEDENPDNYFSKFDNACASSTNVYVLLA